MIDIASGHAAIDRYLADGYARVPGMSSRFAAAICGHVIRRQTELGIAGDMVEIGTFEGRFFIAMALGLQPGERALGIDVFDWPDEGVHGRLLSHCAAAGLAGERFFTWKGNTRTLPPDGLRSRLGDQAGALHPHRRRSHPRVVEPRSGAGAPRAASCGRHRVG